MRRSRMHKDSKKMRVKKMSRSVAGMQGGCWRNASFQRSRRTLPFDLSACGLCVCPSVEMNCTYQHVCKHWTTSYNYVCLSWRPRFAWQEFEPILRGFQNKHDFHPFLVWAQADIEFPAHTIPKTVPIDSSARTVDWYSRGRVSFGDFTQVAKTR